MLDLWLLLLTENFGRKLVSEHFFVRKLYILQSFQSVSGVFFLIAVLQYFVME